MNINTFLYIFPKTLGQAWKDCIISGAGHHTLHELINEHNKHYLHWGFIRNPL